MAPAIKKAVKKTATNINRIHRSFISSFSVPYQLDYSQVEALHPTSIISLSVINGLLGMVEATIEDPVPA